MLRFLWDIKWYTVASKKFCTEQPSNSFLPVFFNLIQSQLVSGLQSKQNFTTSSNRQPVEEHLKIDDYVFTEISYRKDKLYLRVSSLNQLSLVVNLFLSANNIMNVCLGISIENHTSLNHSTSGSLNLRTFYGSALEYLSDFEGSQIGLSWSPSSINSSLLWIATSASNLPASSTNFFLFNTTNLCFQVASCVIHYPEAVPCMENSIWMPAVVQPQWNKASIPNLKF